VPDTVLAGIVAAIVPLLAILDKVPILAVPLEKEPELFESCAVYTFPEIKVPVLLNGTETEAPAQKGEPFIGPVVITCARRNPEIKSKNCKKIATRRKVFFINHVSFLVICNQ